MTAFLITLSIITVAVLFPSIATLLKGLFQLVSLLVLSIALIAIVVVSLRMHSNKTQRALVTPEDHQ